MNMQINSHENTKKVGCETEYDLLEKVLVCPPSYMKIGKIINETQKHYKSENIDVDIALKQHNVFVKTLEELGVEVISLDPNPALYEQVFTRDIGFCIGEKIYTANMQRKIREPEVQALATALRRREISYHKIEEPSIEGGDVMIDGHIIWIGVSERTTLHAIHALQKLLPEYQIIPLPIAEGILHLDCAFNCIAQDTALVYPKAFTKEDFDKIRQHYPQLIEISEEEQFTLATNVFSLGSNRIISLPENKRVNQQLRKHGFNVSEVPFNEIIKSGGSFRCCTLPLYRTK